MVPFRLECQADLAAIVKRESSLSRCGGIVKHLASYCVEFARSIQPDRCNGRFLFANNPAHQDWRSQADLVCV